MVEVEDSSCIVQALVSMIYGEEVKIGFPCELVDLLVLAWA